MRGPGSGGGPRQRWGAQAVMEATGLESGQQRSDQLSRAPRAIGFGFSLNVKSVKGS